MGLEYSGYVWSLCSHHYSLSYSCHWLILYCTTIDDDGSLNQCLCFVFSLHVCDGG